MHDLHSHHIASTSTFPLDKFAQDLCDTIYINATKKGPKRPTHLDVESLACLWNIGLPAAKNTLNVTTQDHVRQLNNGINRRVKTQAHQRQYRHIGGYLGGFASDTFKMPIKSTRGNEYVQLFSNKAHFIQSYPMKEKGHAHHSLDRFIHDVGVPHKMMTDGAKELHMAEWGKICRKFSIHQKNTEPHSPWRIMLKWQVGL